MSVVLREGIGMVFVKSKAMKIAVLPEQEKNLSSKENIEIACTKPEVMAFDIYQDEMQIGFVMVKRFEEGAFFLWDYAIDHRYQNRNYGTAALIEFISFMQKEHNMNIMTTTYVWGNEHAKHVYEKIGFVETDVVDEGDCHEVNMVYRCG